MAENSVGKYDEDCEAVLLKHKALGAIVVVVGGDKGHGFSVSTVSKQFAYTLPRLLRTIADDIEMQNQGGTPT